MQTLGLAGPEQKPDNIVKRLFWPANNPSEVDTLGQQGFWICLVVGTISLISFSVAGYWYIGLIAAIFFVLGGIGVREHSVLAAALVASAYVLNILAAILARRAPGLLDVFIALLLAANIRGTWIASAWMAKGDPQLFPERSNSGFVDQVVDQMPRRIWPKGRFLFYAFSIFYFLVLIVGSAGLLATRMMHRDAHSITQEQPDPDVVVKP